MLKRALIPLLCATSTLGAQSLAKRVAAANGTVAVIYPSRADACGDGHGTIMHVLGENRFSSGTTFYGDHMTGTGCVHGPARVVATVIDGEITRLRTYVGPVTSTPDASTIEASAGDASAWLGDLVAHGTSRVAADAMLALVLADTDSPWPLLLRVARDRDRPMEVRRSSLTWLSMGVSDKLGLPDDHGATDEDEIRNQAVFAISQRPRTESIPELIDIARNSTHPSARRAAIFWLGQTGDVRAADVYADLLKLR